MPTQRGWLLALGGVVLVVGGRLLAVLELLVAGVGAMALVLGAVAYVRLARWHLEVVRQLRPARVHAGSSSRVELAAHNTGRRPSPLLTARDPFDGGRRWARFILPPLRPGERARAAYRLPTDRRGVYDLGPLTLDMGDPFGLARRSRPSVPATKLTVYPRVDHIEPLPLTRGNDPIAGSHHPSAVGSVGEDFYALREYDVGDDIRRVHWKSTAKRDELMIRQDETPWQGRVTVVLDLRQDVHTADSLEVAVSAAASIVNVTWRQRSLVRLVTSDGLDSGFAAGQGHAETIMERLAVAKGHPGSDLVRMLAALLRESGGGALVVVTTAAAEPADLAAVARVRRRFGTVNLVLLERSVLGLSPDARHLAVTRSLAVVSVTAADDFSSAWNGAMAARPRRSRAGVGR